MRLGWFTGRLIVAAPLVAAALMPLNLRAATLPDCACGMVEESVYAHDHDPLPFGGQPSDPSGPQEFIFLGSAPTKWDMGPNKASKHGFTAPAGPRLPGSATFSIMPSGIGPAVGLNDPGHFGTTVPITSLAVPGYTTVAQYAAIFNWALDTWAAVSGFQNLGQVADAGAPVGASDAVGGNMGDIRIGVWRLDTPSTTIAHGFQPGTNDIFGTAGSLGGDLHFDTGRIWVDDPNAIANTGRYDIYSVVLHEIGHTLGLGHSSVPGSVMAASYAGARRTLTPDDIAGIQAIYGLPIPLPPALWGGLAMLAGCAMIRRKV